jgi:hypothetical protein
MTGAETCASARQVINMRSVGVLLNHPIRLLLCTWSIN